MFVVDCLLADCIAGAGQQSFGKGTEFMNCRIFALVIIGATVTINCLVEADTFTGTLNGVDVGENVVISGTNQWAGEIGWDNQDGGTSDTYCTPFYPSIGQGATYTFDVIPIETMPALTTSGVYADAITKACMIEFAVGSAQTTLDADQAAGMQVAIWKIVADYSSGNSDWADPSGGSITWDTSTTWGRDANLYLGYAVDPIGAVPVDGLQEIQGPESSLAYDFLQGPNPQPGKFHSVVPAPAVFWSLPCLLGMYGLVTHLRARRWLV